jgi:hypothetical protein
LSSSQGLAADGIDNNAADAKPLLLLPWQLWRHRRLLQQGEEDQERR